MFLLEFIGHLLILSFGDSSHLIFVFVGDTVRFFNHLACLVKKFLKNGVAGDFFPVFLGWKLLQLKPVHTCSTFGDTFFSQMCRSILS